MALGPFLRSIAEVREGHIHGQLALQKGTCTADLSPEPPHDAHSLKFSTSEPVVPASLQITRIVTSQQHGLVVNLRMLVAIVTLVRVHDN